MGGFCAVWNSVSVCTGHCTQAPIRLHSRRISLGNHKAKWDPLITMQQPINQIRRKYLLSASTVCLHPRLLLQHTVKASPKCYWPRSCILWNTKQILITVFCYSWPQLWDLYERKIHRPWIKSMPLFAQEISPVAISNPLYIQMGICIPGFLGKSSSTQCKLTSLWSVSYDLFLCLRKTELEPFGQDLFCEDHDIHVKCK